MHLLPHAEVDWWHAARIPSFSMTLNSQLRCKCETDNPKTSFGERLKMDGSIRRFRKEEGFTLAELLVVVAIIAVLVAIAIPVFTSAVANANAGTDAANIRAGYASAQTKVIDERTAPGTVFVLLNDGGVCQQDNASGSAGLDGAYATKGQSSDANGAAEGKVDIAGQSVSWSVGQTVTYTVLDDGAVRILAAGGGGGSEGGGNLTGFASVATMTNADMGDLMSKLSDCTGNTGNLGNPGLGELRKLYPDSLFTAGDSADERARDVRTIADRSTVYGVALQIKDSQGSSWYVYDGKDTYKVSDNDYDNLKDNLKNTSDPQQVLKDWAVGKEPVLK